MWFPRNTHAVPLRLGTARNYYLSRKSEIKEYQSNGVEISSTFSALSLLETFFHFLYVRGILWKPWVSNVNHIIVFAFVTADYLFVGNMRLFLLNLTLSLVCLVCGESNWVPHSSKLCFFYHPRPMLVSLENVPSEMRSFVWKRKWNKRFFVN